MLQRYGGEKNVLSANVHNDETTPHMHFAFMPVVWDEKKQREKVSAKEILNRKDLRTFHQDLDVFLKQEIPHIYQGGILNEKTIDIENVKELKKMSDEIKRIKKELVIDFQFYGEPKEVLKKVESSIKNTMFGDRVSLPSKDYEQLKKLALSTVGAKHVLDRVRETSDKKIERLETNIERANKQVENLEIQVRSLKRSEQLLKHEVEKSEEYREDSIIYESMLRDAGISTQLSLPEREGYLILHKFENGYEPKNQKECEKWLNVMEDNKIAGTISSKRLERLIASVKAFLDRLLGKRQELSSDGLGDKQEGLKQKSEQNEKGYTLKKNKSRDMGR
ncbi:plasmid recombination protein [Bacillus sp. CDB3]|uniref:plasmid recombination protein n=1 Tax=Bacillus sp. CDB3 TaxID=360310 RepID=UPI0021187A09|nr:plasmid recombination protein [Bacillus sp. CDB3]